MESETNILYVEDDADEREMISVYLSGQGYKITTAETSAEAVQVAKKQAFDLFMLDVRLPDGWGADLALRLRKIQPQTPIFYYTASALPEERLETMAKCGEAYLIKPDSFEDIEATIKNLILARKIAEETYKKV